MKTNIFVASNDEKFKKDIELVLGSQNLTLFFDNIRLSNILNILDLDMHLLILDLNEHTEYGLGIIQILKRLIPKYPIVSFISDNNPDLLKELGQLGVLYCGIKPLHESEFPNILMAIERVRQTQVLANGFVTQKAIEL